MALLNLAAFSYLSRLAPLSLVLPYLTFPFLLWAALRFGTRGVTSALLLVAATVIPFVAAGRFFDMSSAASPLDAVVVVQLYLAVVAIPSLFLAVVVTERKRAEESLHHAHERLRHFVDANTVGVVIASPSGEVIEANDYYLHTVGYTREEFEQGVVDWRAITPPEWLPADEHAIRELRELGICTPYEKEYVRRNRPRAAMRPFWWWKTSPPS